VKISYLVDTDWVIDHFNKVEKTTQKLQQLRPDGIALSVVSLAELYEGVYYSRDQAKSEAVLKSLLVDLPVLGIDEETCKVFGRQRGRLRQQGQVVSDFDLLIASTCLQHELTLLTNNRKHYEKVERLTILSM